MSAYRADTIARNAGNRPAGPHQHSAPARLARRAATAVACPVLAVRQHSVATRMAARRAVAGGARSWRTTPAAEAAAVTPSDQASPAPAIRAGGSAGLIAPTHPRTETNRR